jgi:hypothetical protein
MKITNLLPNHYIEHEYFNLMMKQFDSNLFQDKHVIITHNYNELPDYGDHVIVLLTAGNERGGLPAYYNRVGLVFKHHLDENFQHNVYHIPLPYVGGFLGDYNKPILERKYDLVFIGRTPKRKDMWDNALRWRDKHPEKNCFLFNSGQKFRGEKGGMNIQKYSDYMKEAKICLSPKGMVRCECLRFTEAVMCGSAIVACSHPMSLRVFKYCPASYIKSWNDLERVLDSYTEEKLVKTHEKMKQCWDEYFSPPSVAYYINKVVKGRSRVS